jgi:hypothetical protein
MSPALPWLHAIQAAERGNYKLLGDRLVDPTVVLTVEERNFIHTNGYEPPGLKRGPRARYHVTTRSESLEIARTVLRRSNGYLRGQVKAALQDAAKRHGCSVSLIKQRHLPIAKRFWDGNWWKNNCKLVREGKGHKLL